MPGDYVFVVFNDGHIEQEVYLNETAYDFLFLRRGTTRRSDVKRVTYDYYSNRTKQRVI